MLDEKADTKWLGESTGQPLAGRSKEKLQRVLFHDQFRFVKRWSIEEPIPLEKL
jgi:hypothetical protein